MIFGTLYSYTLYVTQQNDRRC